MTPGRIIRATVRVIAGVPKEDPRAEDRMEQYLLRSADLQSTVNGVGDEALRAMSAHKKT